MCGDDADLGGCKRTLGTRAPIASPDLPNQRWSVDFVGDALAYTVVPASLSLPTTSAWNAWHWSQKTDVGRRYITPGKGINSEKDSPSDSRNVGDKVRTLFV